MSNDFRLDTNAIGEDMKPTEQSPELGRAWEEFKRVNAERLKAIEPKEPAASDSLNDKPMTPESKSREAFEKWLDNDTTDTRIARSKYYTAQEQVLGFLAWQASRADLLADMRVAVEALQKIARDSKTECHEAWFGEIAREALQRLSGYGE